MPNPLISVIVITYNQEQTLPIALDSILSQEGPFSMEVIVGEDASTDSTKTILEDYAIRFPSVIRPVYQDCNKGILQNFISCLQKAKGTYIAFCDGDDYWIKTNKLASQLSLLEMSPDVGLVYTDVMIVSKITGEQYYRKMARPKDDLFTQLLQGNIIVSSSVCMRADLLEFVDFGDFISQQFTMEDYPLWLSLSLHTKFSYLPEATVSYVIQRGVVNSKEVGHHAVRFDEGTTKIRLFFKKKYPERTGLTEEEIEDAHSLLAVRSGLNMNDRRFTLRYLNQLHCHSAYTKRLRRICQSDLGFSLYQLYRRLSGKNKSQLQQYFGM